MKKIRNLSILLLVIILSFSGCASNLSPSTASLVAAKKTTSVATNNSDNLIVSFIDVGQGDAILIQQDDNSMLIDAGENNQGDDVVDYLKDQDIDKINYVIGTHPHSDHIGGLDDVIEEFKIGKIIMPNAINTTQTYEDVLDAIDAKNLKITKPVTEKIYKLGDAKFIILAPNSKKYSDLNNYSIVIKLIYKDTSFLFTGDAEELSEKEMIKADYDLSADVLKVAHHGSEYSCSDEFISEVNPSSAVISVGEDNTYNHPSDNTIAKLLDNEIDTYRTDLDGTIVATSDGEGIKFSCKPDSYKIVTPTPVPTVKPTAIPTVTPKPTATPVPTALPTVTPTPIVVLDNQSTTVYITKSGEKYHVNGCSSLSKSKIPISLNDAKAKGYTACSRCNPPQ